MTNISDRHAEVAKVANDAHARDERAVDAVMAAFDVAKNTATRWLWEARAAGHHIDNDQRFGLTEPQRLNQVFATLGDGRAFEPQPWVADANCRSVKTDLFFPERGDTHTQRQALEVCRGCSVRFDCFQYGFNNYERGVWGGTTERQRRQLRNGWLRLEDIA